MFHSLDPVKAAEKLGVPIVFKFTMPSNISQTLLSTITPFQTELCLYPLGFVPPIVKSVKELASGSSRVTNEPKSAYT